MRRSLAALALAVVLPFPGLAPAAALANVVVKPGETLSEIADRHGVSLTRLMQANGITNPNLVVAGQSLRLPGSSAAGAGSSGGGSVTVQPGDTLSYIADRQGISLNQLMQANGITNPDMVVAGQKLVLPGSRRATAAAAPRELPSAPYTVKSGETISEIADRFGTSTERLIQLNGISNPNLVVAGTRLAIPGRPSSSAAPRSTAAPRNAKEHVVRSGESLSTIADSYGLPVERLVAINKIDDPDLVMSGARLKLQAPPPVKATPKPATPKPAAAQAKPQTKPFSSPYNRPYKNLFNKLFNSQCKRLLRGLYNPQYNQSYKRRSSRKSNPLRSPPQSLPRPSPKPQPLRLPQPPPPPAGRALAASSAAASLRGPTGAAMAHCKWTGPTGSPWGAVL